MGLFYFRFRHAALHSITRSKVNKMKEKDDNESQKAMHVLAKSFIGSKFTGASALGKSPAVYHQFY